MRIVIISDTHGDLNAVKRVYSLSGAAEATLHAGDVLSGVSIASQDLADLLLAQPALFAVRGNCDDSRAAAEIGLDLSQEIRLFKLAGRLVLMHHGHRYHCRELMARAAELQAEIVISGHSHRKELFKQDGIVVVNPGSPSRPRDGIPSFALWQDDEIALIDLNRAEVLARQSITGPDTVY